MIAGLLTFFLTTCPWTQESAADADDASGLSAEALRAAFDEAYEADDWERMEALVRGNPARFKELWWEYARPWEMAEDEPGSAELAMFARAATLAEAVDLALDAPGLLATMAILEGMSEEARRELRKGTLAAEEAWSLEAEGQWAEARVKRELAQEIAGEYGMVLVGNAIDLAHCLFVMDEYRNGFELLQRTLPMVERDGDPHQLAEAYTGLGLFHQELGQVDAAIRAHEQALAIRESLGARLCPGSGCSHHSLQLLGASHAAAGRIDEATRYYRRSLQALEAAGAPEAAMLESRLGLADCQFRRGELDRARRSFQELLPLAEAAGGISLHNVLVRLGDCDQGLGQPLRALESLERAYDLDRRSGDLACMAQSLSGLAAVSSTLGQYETALERYREALRLNEQIGQVEGIAIACDGLADAHESLGQYESVRAYREREVALRRVIGKPLDIAKALSALGCYHAAVGEYEQAITRFEQELNLREAAGNSQDIATVLDNLGLCNRWLERHSLARQFSERALELRRAVGDPAMIASSLAGLGMCHERMGDFARAIELNEQALELREQVGDPAELATSFAALANCYRGLGQIERGMELDERALRLREEVGDSQSIRNSLGNLGIGYYELGDYERAIETFERVIVLGDDLDAAISLNWQGLCHYAQGSLPLAADYYRRSLDRARAAGAEDRLTTALAMSNLGLVRGDLGDHEQAVELLQKALALKELAQIPNYIARGLVNLSIHHAALGNHRDALDCLVRAGDELARVPVRRLSEADRIGYEEMRVSSFARLATECGHRLGTRAALEDAFRVVERQSSQALLEGLQEAITGVLAEELPELAARREQVLAQMEGVRLAQLATRMDPTEVVNTESLSRRLQELEVERRDLEGELRRQNPRLGEVAAPGIPDLSEVREQALRPGEVMLRYVLGSPESFVWVITEQSAEIVALDSIGPIREAHEELSRCLEVGTTPRDDRDFVVPARILYQRLLAPVAAQIGAAHRLVIVPDGFLGHLPFEVLLSADVAAGASLPSLPYVLRDHAIRYAPSASFLVFLSRHAPAASSWERDVLLIGDPVFSREVARQDRLAEGAVRSLDPSSFERLESTRDEVLSIARSLTNAEEAATLDSLDRVGRSGSITGSRFDLSLGADANEALLRTGLRGHRILHLATHGYFDAEYPWFSGLLLSSGEEPLGETGFLNLIEIARLPMDAELVFLSACETARGEVWRSEGIRNAARSFLLAGARSVVCTQWRVFDRAAPVVARTFYQQLFEGQAAAAALQAAKLALLSDGVRSPGPGRGVGVREPHVTSGSWWSHPSVWAPFVLWGGQ